MGLSMVSSVAQKGHIKVKLGLGLRGGGFLCLFPESIMKLVTQVMGWVYRIVTVFSIHNRLSCREIRQIYEGSW